MIKTLNSANAPLTDEQKQAIVNTPEFMEKFAVEMDKVESSLSDLHDSFITEATAQCLSVIPFNNLQVDADGYEKLCESPYSKLPNGLKMKALQIIMGSSPKTFSIGMIPPSTVIAIAAREFAHIMTQSDEIRDRLVNTINAARKLGI